ncbi:hypothetical protein [Flavobacterium piscisymbiosum]|uniref:Phage protein n=1 Tax=Flavobacterium piscisymbiosum TaxID=2893753 RepID=A0ABS8M7M6_9FLAO|nr:hypothetical protein [Flavobacterium sp. F-30]MCC9061442.1 hypothetical protein [Flavobacterium sp. F-30]
MKAIVKKIDYQKGFVYVSTEENNTSMFEMLSDDNFEIEDVLSWEEYEHLGHCEIKNITQNEIVEVFFQNH